MYHSLNNAGGPAHPLPKADYRRGALPYRSNSQNHDHAGSLRSPRCDLASRFRRCGAGAGGWWSRDLTRPCDGRQAQGGASTGRELQRRNTRAGGGSRGAVIACQTFVLFYAPRTFLRSALCEPCEPYPQYVVPGWSEAYKMLTTTAAECMAYMTRRKTALEQIINMVDLQIEASAITPRKASRRLAILLLLGILSFVGVIIITAPITRGGLKLPDIECSDIVVGHTPNTLLLLGVGGSRPIYEPKYEIVIRDIHIPLPTALIRIFVQGSRCNSA
jgi:hypothetical protein